MKTHWTKIWRCSFETNEEGTTDLCKLYWIQEINKTIFSNHTQRSPVQNSFVDATTSLHNFNRNIDVILFEKSVK